MWPIDQLVRGNGNGHASLAESEVRELRESLAALELALEDVNWVKLSLETNQEFSRDGLQRIMDLSRLFFLKNPIINRGVNTQVLYVWGQGISIQGKHPKVDAVVQAFMDDPQNRAELTSHQARTLKEQDLQVDGNIFFTLFSHIKTGRVRVSTIPPDEIKEIIFNPDNRKEPWYYKRTWTQSTTDPVTGIGTSTVDTAYYPNWRYVPANKPNTFGGKRVEWSSPVYHVKVGGLSGMAFGVPETYSALDWSRAYKEFLEDWATIVRAYSKFAFQLTTPGGKKGIAAGKAKLNTTISSSNYSETNPPPLAGSTLVSGPDVQLQPVRTGGATTSANDGRRMLLMAAMAFGLPETFFSDVSVGTLATAKSLDRPTELKFADRQSLWKDIYMDLLNYQIDKRVVAPGYSALGGKAVPNAEGDGTDVILEVDSEAVDAEGTPTDEPINRHIDIDFPSILEHDTKAEIDGIVEAATLGGKPLAGTMDMKLTSRLLLSVLGQDDIDDLLADMFPEDDGTPAGAQTAAQAEQSFVTAVQEMREALRSLVEVRK